MHGESSPSLVLLATLKRLLGFSAERALRGHRGTGQRGEAAAEKHLRRQGYRIVARNWRVPQGEVDLIARQGETLVFVEVKSGRAGSPVPPQVHMNAAKQRQLRQLAEIYSKQHGALGQARRVDLIEVLWAPDGRVTEIRHHQAVVRGR